MSDVDVERIIAEDQDKPNSCPGIGLLDLPVEILLHICSFLNASTLVHGLSLTCKYLHDILNDDSLWKYRISLIYPNVNYPPLPCDNDELFWKLSCVAVERQAKLWKNENKMEKVRLNVHYSTIDGLLLMHGGKTVVSGGRDRCLVLCHLSGEEYGCHEPVSVQMAHDGWIWDLTAIGDTIYSCSWDRSVKAWSITNAGLSPLTKYEMIVHSALLCVTSCPELTVFATGSYCKSVLVFDPRTGEKPIVKYESHQRPVIRLAMNSNYILSASEDKTVNIWDQRARRSMKSITISKESFPMSLCLKKDIVYVGDSSAKIHILDPKRNFEPVRSYKTDHEKSITGVYVDSGCLITSSLDKTVQITSPTDPPKPIRSLLYANGEIASIDYLNEVLAISGTDAIEIWRPRDRTKCS